MEGFFTIDYAKSEHNAKKNMTVLPKKPSVIIPVWGEKLVEHRKLVGLHWVTYTEKTPYKYF